ncbi:urea ABC transporter permease subunit UrtB [Geminisphaera colitermitum]|uniref:urea ABC transporter permease subunit UrtB n=1 Tax=Geminisphaera colitermitum TaxID=1148786 RepID=UPI00069377CB
MPKNSPPSPGSRLRTIWASSPNSRNSPPPLPAPPPPPPARYSHTKGRQIAQSPVHSSSNPSAELAAAARRAVMSVESHYRLVNFWGTAFRGLSLSSVLLVTALGLAITYGLMGIINMAHGEIMVVGAYATYVTQNLFSGWFGADSAGYNYYFLAALPAAFLAAALVGLVLERSIIQWLYRRPLESLLATWGVSLALQQGFRTIFGPANVQINSPAWLRGNIEFADITFTYNRIFVIAFAVVVVAGAWLLINRTRFGLYIRAVTQNRAMASCMGVRTERVNMLTFAFGSGLAGLAGACLAQIGNVGPGLGQSHIVDCFMVVVSGGVGSLAGTVYAALGIGSIDQILQPFLGAVMGKILVLVAIILFLQWKPGGLFPTRNRSLD